MSYITWIKAECPHCRKPNWAYGPDPFDDDCTNMDDEALECWSCGKFFWIVEDWKDYHGHLLEEEEFDDGDDGPYTEEQILEKFSNSSKGREAPNLE